MNKMLTILVPMYNIKDYIEKCLASIISCEKIREKIEVIVVNDGSKDESLIAAQNIAIRYPDVIKIIDKKNGGHGSTINKGIEIANGEFFFVVDGDDTIDSNALNNILDEILKIKYDNVDIIYFNHVIDYRNENVQKKISLKSMFKIEKKIFELNGNNIKTFSTYGMPNYIIKTRILKELNIRLLEKTFYVDMEYVLYPLRNIKTALYFNEYVYYYFVGRNGQSVSKESLLKNIPDRERVIKALCKNYELTSDNMEYYAIKMWKVILGNMMVEYYMTSVACKYSMKEMIKCCKDISYISPKFDKVSDENLYLRLVKRNIAHPIVLKILLYIKIIKGKLCI